MSDTRGTAEVHRDDADGLAATGGMAATTGAAVDAGWADRVRRLAAERGAVILAHNYQRAEIQEVADHVGDSLALARLAAASPARVIVLCGVYFMAETAKILAPDRTVLIPDARPAAPSPTASPSSSSLPGRPSTRARPLSPT